MTFRISERAEATHAAPMNSRGPVGSLSQTRLKENKSVACPQLRSTELCTSPKQECGPLITMSSINYCLKYGSWLVMRTPPPWRGVTVCANELTEPCGLERGPGLHLGVLGLLPGREAGGPQRVGACWGKGEGRPRSTGLSEGLGAPSGPGPFITCDSGAVPGVGTGSSGR